MLHNGHRDSVANARPCDCLMLSIAGEDKKVMLRKALRNSSAIFLSIKFAHRWSSPGALKATLFAKSYNVNLPDSEAYAPARECAPILSHFYR